MFKFSVACGKACDNLIMQFTPGVDSEELGEPYALSHRNMSCEKERRYTVKEGVLYQHCNGVDILICGFCRAAHRHHYGPGLRLEMARVVGFVPSMYLQY